MTYLFKCDVCHTLYSLKVRMNAIDTYKPKCTKCHELLSREYTIPEIICVSGKYHSKTKKQRDTVDKCITRVRGEK